MPTRLSVNLFIARRTPRLRLQAINPSGGKGACQDFAGWPKKPVAAISEKIGDFSNRFDPCPPASSPPPRSPHGSRLAKCDRQDIFAARFPKLLQQEFPGELGIFRLASCLIYPAMPLEIPIFKMGCFYDSKIYQIGKEER